MEKLRKETFYQSEYDSAGIYQVALSEIVNRLLAAESVSKAIKKAQEDGSMQKGCLFHSDRGCQYTSAHVRKALGQSIRQSMSAKGYCYDNAFAETCFATIKAEILPDSQIFESKLEARRAVFDYIETFYNRIRRHSSLGQVSPLQFLQLYNKNKTYI